MRLLPAAATLVTLALFAPNGAANGDSGDASMIFGGQPQEVRIEVGTDFIDISVDDITIPGELAHEIRVAIDNSFLADEGEPDGVVSSDEVSRIERAARALANQHFAEEPLDFVTIDGNPATSTRISRVNVEGLAGDVESTNPIVTDITIRVGFLGVDDSLDSHTVRLEQLYGDFSGEYDATHFPPVTVIVTGKEPWTLDTDSVEPEEMAARAEDGKLVFDQDDVQSFDEVGEYLQFTVAGDPDADFNPAPGVEIVGLLGAVGAAVFLARRK